MKTPRHVLPVIVISQFFCTSLWFAGNGVMSDLLQDFNLSFSALGYITSAVQFGFIIGTLIFAILNIADRISPSKLFFACALLGAVFNLGVILEYNTLGSLLTWRFLTGFALAGIYPVGMKIAADHFQADLGKSLGWLVGALVLGTGFPHLLKMYTGAEGFIWKTVMITTSGMAVAGGILILAFVPHGPYRKPKKQLDFLALFKIFKIRKFRAAAFGYFGHMWELYAFWAFVPVILGSYNKLHPGANIHVSLISFLIISLGALGCIMAGYISLKKGPKATAGIALLFSGLCCILSPLMFLQDSVSLLLMFLMFWGFMVVADSPLFSTLVAQNSLPETRGTALTIVNCLGFAITIISIQLITLLIPMIHTAYVFMVLALGPALGLWNLFLRKNMA